MNIACVVCESSLSPEYGLMKFLQDVNEIMFYVAAPAICLVLWRLLVTNRGVVTSLRLNEHTSLHSPQSNDR